MAEKGAGGLKPNLTAIQPSSLCGAALGKPKQRSGTKEPVDENLQPPGPQTCGKGGKSTGRGKWTLASAPVLG